MKLSEKRKQAIAEAVYERITRLRIELARSSELTGTKLGEQIDYRIAKAMNDAASAAVRAAEG